MTSQLHADEGRRGYVGMAPELEMQQHVLALWVRNLRKKVALIQSVAGCLRGQENFKQAGQMLDGFARDCDKLYELGYEIGYLQGFRASEAAGQGGPTSVH
jgi:hypothetical protein